MGKSKNQIKILDDGAFQSGEFKSTRPKIIYDVQSHEDPISDHWPHGVDIQFL